MKTKLNDNYIAYTTIRRVGTILLTIFIIFFTAHASAYAQEPAAVAADDAMEAPAADNELTMTAVKEAKAAKAASSDITTLF